MADGVAQPRGFDRVVRINDADDLGTSGEPASGLIQGPGLETRPGCEVHDREPRTQIATYRLDRLPHPRILGVVVHDLDFEVGVVEFGEGFERRTYHLYRFVVCGDLNADPGRTAGG